MERPNIATIRGVTPMIYAYTTPEIVRHNGWTKIGYTEQDVETRIKQQTHTADVQWHLEWKGNAIFDDGTGDRFTDKDFHSYLRKFGTKQEEGKNNEWFQITGAESQQKFWTFRSSRGILETLGKVIPYQLRQEQEEAVAKTIAYRNSHHKGEFLWNAKPRFGKTLAVYDFCKKIQAQTVLILTQRPAIANSWFDDYAKFLGPESGYRFVSQVEALKDRAGVLSRQEYTNLITSQEDEEMDRCIEFVSLQDMKGSKYFSPQGIDKLREVAEMNWDVLVIDEAHEGVDTFKTGIAFDRIKRNFTLHLSGTPFKALANNKFSQDAIYNWTYADEQKAKRDWDVTSEEENPYAILPKLNMFTYQMSEIVKDELQQGIMIQGETAEYAFDLNEFFATEQGKFKHESSVDKFLDAMTKQLRFPFSTPELRHELKHTFWLLDRVDSAKALAEKLKTHPVFGEYEIVLAAGDGKTDDDKETKKSYEKVVKAIKENDRTITLSVGQLTTGITIPEWTAVLMLSNVKSPALYMQAAFRAQNPCMFHNGTSYGRKENAYVFDFDPARTLNIFEQFANDLSTDTASGRGDIETRKANIRELLNFFPVIGEDEQGELIELDAEKVLTIPRKIRAVEVVKRGFMSNYLFQNISQVFGAPAEVIDIISGLQPVKEAKDKVTLTDKLEDDIFLNEAGDVDIPEEIVVGKTQDVFGDKIFGNKIDIGGATETIITKPDKAQTALEKLKKDTHKQITDSIIATAKAEYGSEMKQAVKGRMVRQINDSVDRLIEKSYNDFAINKNIIEQERQEQLKAGVTTGQTAIEINKEFDEKIAEAKADFQTNLQEGMAKLVEDSKQDVINAVETSKQEQQKNSIEGDIRDHLRGFSRTIPAFLMAYGTGEITLENFDSIVPEDVFKEVTGISLEQFIFLRDGGSYIDPETGENKNFVGQL
ncbi:MAG: DEAD/DEAH box helicase family protein, partial [Veillonellaceae bacterium]|nr:DEAD/DEAH box helicase family protein [Veillonellaceae bacterium]